MAPEAALVTAGVELGVLGIGYDTLPTETREASSPPTRAPTSSAGSSAPSMPVWPTAPGPLSAM